MKIKTQKYKSGLGWVSSEKVNRFAKILHLSRKFCISFARENVYLFFSKFYINLFRENFVEKCENFRGGCENFAKKYRTEILILI